MHSYQVECAVQNLHYEVRVNVLLFVSVTWV
jgi:hypothetical protein